MSCTHLLVFLIHAILAVSIHESRHSNACGRGMRMCRSVHRCVADSRWCDGVRDCHDYSDEYTCPNFVCPAGKFHCRDGPCIPSMWRCDGILDCADESDEDGCGNTNPCGNSNLTMCHSVLKCIHNTKLCDGVSDCHDHSDEYTCPGFVCPDGKFHCRDGPCIPSRWRCDGDPDCADESDEDGCGNTNPCGNSNLTMCHSVLKCIHNTKLCDGVSDCHDHSDEYTCPGFVCPDGKFHCSDGPCINPRWRCDHEPDCADRSDEVGCRN